MSPVGHVKIHWNPLRTFSEVFQNPSFKNPGSDQVSLAKTKKNKTSSESPACIRKFNIRKYPRSAEEQQQQGPEQRFQRGQDGSHLNITVELFVCLYVFTRPFLGEGKFPSMVKLPAACLSSYKLLQSVIFQLRVHFHWFFDGIPTALRFFYWFSGIHSRCGMFQKSWSWLPFQNSFPECAMCKMQLFTVESIRHTHILQMLIHLNPSQHIWHISIHVHPLLTCSGISYVPVSTYTQIAHHFLFFLAFSESLMSARPSRSVRSGSLGQS